MGRYAFEELHKLESKIFDLNAAKSNQDVFDIAKLICNIVKDELYNNQDRMDSYKAWNEIQKLLIENKLKIEKQ